MKKFFCEIIASEKGFSAGLKIVFDFGDSQVYSSCGNLKDDHKLVDVFGNDIKFVSIIDAANFLSERGWEFVQAYSTTYNSLGVNHWIFSKLANNKSEAMKGLITKEIYQRNRC